MLKSIKFIMLLAGLASDLRIIKEDPIKDCAFPEAFSQECLETSEVKSNLKDGLGSYVSIGYNFNKYPKTKKVVTEKYKTVSTGVMFPPANLCDKGDPCPMPKKYFEHTYPADHWALHMPSPDDPNFIALLDISGIRFSVLLNPSDARGYRLVLSLIDDDLKTTLNRPYTDEEEAALNLVISLMGSVYSELGMAVTAATAGNNAQSLDHGTIVMGNEHEPSRLHGHVIGRGDPNRNYLAGVPLRGPIVGTEFNMRGNGKEPGNDKKIKWNAHDIEATAHAVSQALLQKLANSPYYQKRVEVESIRSSLTPPSSNLKI